MNVRGIKRQEEEKMKISEEEKRVKYMQYKVADFDPEYGKEKNLWGTMFSSIMSGPKSMDKLLTCIRQMRDEPET